MNEHFAIVFCRPGTVLDVLVTVDDEPCPRLADADGFHRGDFVVAVGDFKPLAVFPPENLHLWGQPDTKNGFFDTPTD